MSEDRFVAAIGQCDIVLDSIGWAGNNSTLEGMANDVPIVAMAGPFMRGRHTSAMLGLIGSEETIATTPVQSTSRRAVGPRSRLALSHGPARRQGKHRLFQDDGYNGTGRIRGSRKSSHSSFAVVQSLRSVRSIGGTLNSPVQNPLSPTVADSWPSIVVSAVALAQRHLRPGAKSTLSRLTTQTGWWSRWSRRSCWRFGLRDRA